MLINSGCGVDLLINVLLFILGWYVSITWHREGVYEASRTAS